MAQKRIQRELQNIKSEQIKNLIELKPVDEKDLFHCRAIFMGPEGSPYEGGTFYLKINFPTDYPFKPPDFKIETKIFHPNIFPNGFMCLDELLWRLKSEWSPAFTIGRLLTLIFSLLSNPNTGFFYNKEANELYKKNKDEFYKKARDYAIIYANAPTDNKDFFYLKGKERIEYELNNVEYDENIEISKEESIYSFYKLKTIIKRPKDSPYEKEKLELFFDFPKDYPLEPFRFYISSSGYDDYLNSVEKICNLIVKEKWNRLFLIKDSIRLIIKCLNKNFIKNIIDNKDNEMMEKINELEKLLNKEKMENQNLLEQNKKLDIKLKESEELINTLLQENSNLNKKIYELEELSKKTVINNSINKNNLEYDKLMKDYNNLKNDYNKLMNDYKIIWNEKKKLKRENDEKNNNKIVNKDINVKFISIDQQINFDITCSGDSTFAEIEELLYREYPDYRETNNIFLANGKEILRFKSINENNIGEGIQIILYQPQQFTIYNLNNQKNS